MLALARLAGRALGTAGAHRNAARTRARTPSRTAGASIRARCASNDPDDPRGPPSRPGPPSSSSPSPSSPARRDDDDAAALTVAQLKSLLRSRGERVGGRKADLVARVLATGGAATPGTPGERTPTDPAGGSPSPRGARAAPSSLAAPSSPAASSSSSSVNTRRRKKPHPHPARMRWVVTDPPPPPRRPFPPGDPPSLRVLSWNVNGLRALLDKDPDVLDRVAREEDADVVVLNETKLQEKMVPEMDARVLPEFPHRRWNCATARLGYSGVAVFCRDRVVRARRTKRWPATPRDSETDDSSSNPPDDGSDETSGSSPVRSVFTSDPFEVPGFENEGRVITAELDAFFVVGAYVPNSGSTLGRLAPRISAWDPAAAAYLRSLERRGKPVVFCGDLNVARGELDLWGRHAENAKCAGYTPEERESFEGLFVGGGGGGKDDGGEDVTHARDDGWGLADTFREAWPGRRQYTWWSYRGGARAKNRGWRIDYVLVSSELRGRVHEGYIRGDVGGSDHCPVGVVIR